MELEEAKRILNDNLKNTKEFIKVVNLNKMELGKNYLLQNEAIEIILQALENSISKEVIEKKIEEYFEYDKKHNRYMSDGRECYTNEYYKALTLQELLDKKE